MLTDSNVPFTRSEFSFSSLSQHPKLKCTLNLRLLRVTSTVWSFLKRVTNVFQCHHVVGAESSSLRPQSSFSVQGEVQIDMRHTIEHVQVPLLDLQPDFAMDVGQALQRTQTTISLGKNNTLLQEQHLVSEVAWRHASKDEMSHETDSISVTTEIDLNYIDTQSVCTLYMLRSKESILNESDTCLSFLRRSDTSLQDHPIQVANPEEAHAISTAANTHRHGTLPNRPRKETVTWTDFVEARKKVCLHQASLPVIRSAHDNLLVYRALDRPEIRRRTSSLPRKRKPSSTLPVTQREVSVAANETGWTTISVSSRPEDQSDFDLCAHLLKRARERRA